MLTFFKTQLEPKKPLWKRPLKELISEKNKQMAEIDLKKNWKIIYYKNRKSDRDQIYERKPLQTRKLS